MCVTLAANATCASATVVTGTTVITGENVGAGGPRPTGTGCGTGSGNNALYYLVTVPPGAAVNVTTAAATLNRVLLTEDACGDPACTFRTDTAPESTRLVNATASPVTRVVVIHNSTSTGTGTFDITFSYFTPTIITEIEPNEDGTPNTGASVITGNDFDATAIANATANGVITADTLINAALTPAGDEDVFAIRNTGASPVSVTIQTGAPTADVCPSADTGIRIRAADLSTVASDDDSGPGFCSRVVVTIPPGVTYYVQVVEYDDNAIIDPYQLAIDFF